MNQTSNWAQSKHNVESTLNQNNSTRQTSPAVCPNPIYRQWVNPPPAPPHKYGSHGFILRLSLTFMSLPTYQKQEQKQLYLPLNILQKEKLVISIIHN